MSVTSAQTNFVFQQNTIVDLKISCFNTANNFCNSSVICNATILRPNHEVVIDNKQMTFNTAFFNLTLNETDTSVLGRHSTIGICTGNTTGFSTFTFDITPSGAVPITPGEGSTLFGIIIILVLLTIFFTIATIVIPNIPFKVFLGSMSVLMLVATIGFGVTVMQQLFGTNTILISGFTLFFRVFVILLGAAAAGLILYLVFVALTAFNRNRGIKE